MKKMVIAGALVALFLLAAAGPALAVEEGVLDEVRGEAKVISFEGEPRPAVAGDYVLSGEMIETGDDGFVRVIMAEGSVMEIRSKSRVEVIDSRARSGSRMVVLYLGRLWAAVAGEEDGATVLEVATPTSVAGVRGTAFDAGVGMDGATRVGVDKGVVEVSSDKGSTEVAAGKETTVDWDAAPTAPTHYDNGEQRWREWVLERQDRLIRNGDRIVPIMMRDVRAQRRDLARLKREGDRRMRRLKAQAERQKAAGKPVRLTPMQKRALAGYIRDVIAAVRDLYAADRKMMTRYYLLKQIQADAHAHPDLYKPEFVKVVDDAVAELDEMDIQQIHRENRQIIAAYVNGLDEFFRKHQLGPYKNGAVPPRDRKEELNKARQDYRASKKE